MKIRFLLLTVLLSLSSLSFSQDKYWVYFKDKNNSSFSIQYPEKFLSEKAIDRRFRQGIKIEENDLPVNSIYIDELQKIAPHIQCVSKWMNAVSVYVKNASQINAIAQLPFVARIAKVGSYRNNEKTADVSKSEPVISIGVPAFDPNVYGAGYNQVHMIALDSLHALGYKGRGMEIAVFDAGFIKVDDLDFFETARNEGRIIPVWNYVDTNANVFIRSFHGMSVMSVMCANLPNNFVGAAPEATYYLFITEDQYHERTIEEDNWIAAAEKADSIGVDIFTTSLGYTEFEDTLTNHTYGHLTGDSLGITKAANIAFSKGILVVNSAGNEGNSSWRYISAPADGDSVLTIGAVNESGILAGFSSRGPNSSNHLKPNVCGQGANITVASTNNSEVGKSNGTSFSCPLIAAASACLWQAFPNKSGSQIFHEVERSAHLYNTPNFDYGFGIPNYFNAYKKWENELYDENPSLSIPKVYPNPFRNVITILWNSNSDEPLTIELCNAIGQIVSTQNISVAPHTFSKIFISQLDDKDAGLYLLRIKQNGKTYTTSLVKY